MINICENCEHGYPSYLTACHWCGTLAAFARSAPLTVSALDIECYRNYFLVKMKDAISKASRDFQLLPGHPLDIPGLIRALSVSQIITFNGQSYDVPMLTLALTGVDNAILKQASNEIIVGNLRSWQFYERWNLKAPRWIDHIDLFEVAPGAGSLKMYGGKMHSRRLQDLPFPPDASIELFDRPVLREYCGNDLDTTLDMLATFPEQLALREQMTAEYGVDVRSKSDAQIAEAVMKQLLPFKPEPPAIAAGTQFYFRAATWLKFISLNLLEVLARSPFTINGSGGVTMPAVLDNLEIKIGSSIYRMGIGGLHSSESAAVHLADSSYSLRDVDVTGYYPSLILLTGIFPQQIGPEFQNIYRGWVETRVVAKRAGNKKKANSFKTLTNGTFGKLGSPWSIFYAPTEMIQVTVTGQLALLMLIELLEACGVSVVSANTDGVLIKCPRHLEWLRDDIITTWQAQTGLETEAVNYRLIASRDVNNYIAIDETGKAKLKGAYAPPDPGASGWPNPTGQICVDAIVAWLLDPNKSIAATIRACTDIRKFVYIRQVKGGGEWVAGKPYNKTATQKEMREALLASTWIEGPQPKFFTNTADGVVVPIKNAYQLLFDQQGEQPEYLGKAVRWYYATGDAGHIRYQESHNLVPRTEGSRPLMTLPEEMPVDVDFDWYTREAYSMLNDMGIM